MCCSAAWRLIGLAAGGTRLTTHHAAALEQVLGATGGPLLLAYDSDSAGQDAHRPRRARVAELPTGLDPADVLVATGPADCAAPWP